MVKLLVLFIVFLIAGLVTMNPAVLLIAIICGFAAAFAAAGHSDDNY